MPAYTVEIPPVTLRTKEGPEQMILQSPQHYGPQIKVEGGRIVSCVLESERPAEGAYLPATARLVRACISPIMAERDCPQWRVDGDGIADIV